jgi:hypothetical protein
MAKKKGRPKNDQANGSQEPATESISGYFRRVFDDNPGLLGARSNDAVLQRWLADHPGDTEVPANVKANLANIKSVLRKKRRKKAGRRAAAEQPKPMASAPPRRSAAQGLEGLEEAIDDCLTVARTHDADALAEVIGHLRRARNTVVWKIGQ